MKILIGVALLFCGLFAFVPMRAQEPVTSAADVEVLFHSADPRLDAMKKVAYHIERDLLECGHWELADRYLTQRYLQHNPNAASGLAGVLKYFANAPKKPIPAKTSLQIVSVTAEGDLVTVASVRTMKDPKDPSKTYTTTWFDMWRIKDGKADEHWGCAGKG